jgi:hypothetical protein
MISACATPTPTTRADFKSGGKDLAREVLELGIQVMAEMQERLYAQDRWSLLVVFQAMDAAGKDSAIKHVMSGVNPQSCQVVSFKQPTVEDLEHDYLWRCEKRLPSAVTLGYSTGLTTKKCSWLRVHPELLVAQRLPDEKPSPKLWKQRYKEIRAFRAAPDQQRHAGEEDLPERVAQGTEAPLSRAPLRSGEELEVLLGRREGTSLLEAIHGCIRKTRFALPRHPTPRGSLSPPTTSGTRASSSAR